MTETLEIACDESGYEGEKLIGATTDFFAHAGVHMPLQAAADCVLELRDRIRSPATEYKAGHLLREKHRAVLRWFLGPHSPILGHANVFLVDKSFYILDRVCGPLFADPAEAAEIGSALYRHGPSLYGAARWQEMLAAANALLRVKERLDGVPAVEAFYRVVAGLESGPLDEALARLVAARPRAEALRAGLLADPELSSLLDPLIPAIVRAVRFWGRGVDPVTIVHDRQSTLPQQRVVQLQRLIAAPDRLAGLVHVDSALDPRVQLADIVAGAIRKLAEDYRYDRVSAGLHPAMLRPYLDAESIWGDAESWAALTAAREADPAPAAAPSSVAR